MVAEIPTIVVVGAGAIGGLFGALLTEGGLEVTLIDPWIEHVAAISRNGLRVIGHGGDRIVPIKATLNARDVTTGDVVLFACKATANVAAARAVGHLFGGSAVAVSFQNGLGNEEVLAKELGTSCILGGLTAQGAVVEAPGVIRNYGSFPSLIGEMNGGLSERATRIAAQFTRHNLSTVASPDIAHDKWRKLLRNIGFGPLSAATDMTALQIMAMPELGLVVHRQIAEAVAVARACGIVLRDDEIREVLSEGSYATGAETGGRKSSMAADIAQRRPTEIDIIHGAVALLGRQHDVPTPTIDALIAVVKGIESRYASLA